MPLDIHRSTASSASYLPAGSFTHAYLTANGANFNTNGFDITVGQVLEDKTRGGTLTKSGLGTLTLSGANTYSGATTVSAGVLSLANNLALQNSSLNTSGGGTVTVSTISPTFGGLTGGTNLATLITSGYGNVTALTLNPGTGGANTYSGVITNGAPGMTLTKSGLGTQTLAGANTYTGATAVSAGVLLITGSLAHSTVTVASGATLGGTGSIAGPTTVSGGGILAPGNAVGTLTLSGGLALTSGSVLDFTLGSSSGKIAVTGGAFTDPVAAGSVTVDLSNSGSFSAGTYALIDTTGASIADFNASDFNLGTSISGYDYGFSISDGTLELTATESAVPEPSNYATIVGLIALVAAVLQRRRKANPSPAA